MKIKYVPRKCTVPLLQDPGMDWECQASGLVGKFSKSSSVLGKDRSFLKVKYKVRNSPILGKYYFWIWFFF